MKQTLGIILILLLGFYACKKDPKQELLKQIKEVETDLYNKDNFNREKGIQLVDLYASFFEKFPDDTLADNYLYKAGEIAMNVNLGQRSVAYFNKVIAQYPNFDKIPECIFLKAFVFENQLNNIEKAGEHYSEFIEKYPNHPLVKDAEASLRFLGKSPEELVKIFQEMNDE